MRVEILANPSLPEPSSELPENRALHTLLLAVNAEESFFRITSCNLHPPAVRGAAGPNFFSGSFLLFFSDEAFNRERAHYFALLETLSELLNKAGSADVLEVRLGLSSRADSGPQASAFALFVELVSQGASAEQAELRWGLGVAHLQQAVLFSARLLRKKLSSRGS
jgi:hypothetical protein